MSDEAAANLPIPNKDELLGYLRSSYEAIEQFIESLDTKYPSFENMDEELRKKIETIRLNLLVFLSHDCRHLGMMECLKGLQTPHASIHPFAKRAGKQVLVRQRRRGNKYSSSRRPRRRPHRGCFAKDAALSDISKEHAYDNRIARGENEYTKNRRARIFAIHSRFACMV